jgi:hypothetical protein
VSAVTAQRSRQVRARAPGRANPLVVGSVLQSDQGEAGLWVVPSAEVSGDLVDDQLEGGHQTGNRAASPRR